MSARVVVVGLASDFGCQVQMTNIEDHLLAVLGSIDLSYWQLASSGHMPKEYDVAVIEGAVTTVDHVELLKAVRETAPVVVAVGACALTGGIPALAGGALEPRFDTVYGASARSISRGCIPPVNVEAVIDVDYRVPGCPIRPDEFVSVLQRALMNLSDRPSRVPLCASCKMAENECFYERGELCLGVVTRAGCGAACVSAGRPCTGCRGIADDANIEGAKAMLVEHGIPAEALFEAMALYNSLAEAS